MLFQFLIPLLLDQIDLWYWIIITCINMLKLYLYENIHVPIWVQLCHSTLEFNVLFCLFVFCCCCFLFHLILHNSRLIDIRTCMSFNSMWPVGAIWRHRSRSTLAQLMACMTAPSLYLIRRWLIISKVCWHSHDGKFTRHIKYICHWYEFENYWFNINVASPRGQWVKHALQCVYGACSNPWMSY